MTDTSMQKYFHVAGTQRKIIPLLSLGMNSDLTPGQAISGLKAPLTSFHNEVADDLMRDVFCALYFWEVGLYETPPENREANRLLLEWVWSDPRFQSVRMQLINLQVSATAAAYSIVETLLDDNSASSAMNASARAGKYEEQADQLDERADDMEQGGGSPNNQQDDEQDDEESEDDSEGEASSSPDELRDQAQDLREKAEKERQKAQQHMENFLGNDMNQVMRSGAIKDAQDLGNEISAFLSSWGVDQGDGLELSISEIRSLMALMTTPGLANLTSLVGRTFNAALGILNGRNPQEVSIDTGGLTKNLDDVNPTEQAFLSSLAPAPVREHYMFRFFSSGLPGRIRTSQAKTEGDFLWAVDESISMNTGVWVDAEGTEVTTRHVVAKALTLGMAQAACQNGQGFSVFGFSSDTELTEIVNQNTPLPDLLKWATHEFNGGTSYDLALETLMNLFDNLDEDAKLNADLGITCDGEGHVKPENVERLLALKEKYGVRFHLLLIGDDSLDELEPLADHFMQFTTLADVADQLARAMWE